MRDPNCLQTGIVVEMLYALIAVPFQYRSICFSQTTPITLMKAFLRNLRRGKIFKPFQFNRIIMLYTHTLHSRQSPVYFPGGNQDLYFDIRSLEATPLTTYQEQFPPGVSLYEIIWIKSCSGQLWIDTRFHQQYNNMIYFLVPGQVRRLAPEGTVSGYRIQFSSAILYHNDSVPRIIQTLNQHHHAMGVVADAELQLEMEDIIGKMEKEISNYYLLRSEILAGLLSILLVHFSRRLPAKEAVPAMNRDNLLLKNFLQLVQQYFASRKQVADYASELCVTPNYLNRTIKRVTGFTASYHIQQQIILEAKRKAIHSGRSMKEIAYHLGFDNLAHFSKFFKNNSGTSFSSFRKQINSV
jgi:AraC family transcriptional activator of pobA